MLDYNDAPIKFNIYTRTWDPDKQDFLPDALTASVGPDGKTMRLSGTASSTIRDLHGDEIVESALVDMETAANQNLTIFGNHSYQVPEDVYGSVEAAVLARAVASTKTGEPVHDLKMSIVINTENDRAVKTWKAISKGTKLGLSIGAMIPEGGARIDKKSKRLIIEHLELLETSIVGIPANPRSWVDSARKSYFEAPKTIVESEAVELAPLNYVSQSQTVGDVTQTWTVTSSEPLNTLATQGIDGLTFDGPVDDTPTPESEVVADADPEVEKDIEAASDETPAAPQSEPPSDEVTNSASEAVAIAQEAVVGLDADVTAAFELMADQVEMLVAELNSAREAKAAAERQRDETIKEAAQAIAKVDSIVKKLSELPLGPRAALVRDSAKTDLSDLEGIYSREFLELLRS